MQILISYGESFGSDPFYFETGYYSDNDVIFGINTPWGGRFVLIEYEDIKVNFTQWE